MKRISSDSGELVMHFDFVSDLKWTIVTTART